MFLKKLFHKQTKNLRELCRERYGEDFIVLYDTLSRGIPIGGLDKTKTVLDMISTVKKENNL